MNEKIEYLERRLQQQSKWHSDRAHSNKNWYYTVEIIVLVAGALIPVINVIGAISPDWHRALSALLASAVLLAAGIGKLYKFQENWLTYRALSETLKREKELYLNQVGEYAADGEERKKILVEKVESILSSATSQYIAFHRAKRERPEPQPPAEYNPPAD